MTRILSRKTVVGLAGLTAALLAGAGASAQPPAPAPPPAAPAGEVLINLPGDRIENAFETADGAIYATATFGDKVMRRGRDGALSVFTTVPNPQGVVETKAGMVVDYQDRHPDFSSGRPSTFSGLGAHMVLLDKAGKVVKRLDGLDDNTFFNGMAAGGGDTVFIADDGGDRILKVDLKAWRVEVWLDSAGTHDAAAGPGAPNGLKVHDGWVYFSRGDIYRIRIGRDGKPEGALQLAAKTGGTDDFDVAADGTIYASHGVDVLKVSPTGQVQTLLARGCPFCTATRISRDGRSLYITGGSILGRTPAVAGYVNRIPIGGAP
jgi:sugar lactone lactonase YvrE